MIQSTPRKVNIEPENDGWKITFLLGWLIFRGYVKFLGCNLSRFCCMTFFQMCPNAAQIQEFLVHRRVPLGFHAAWITEKQLLEMRASESPPFFAGRYTYIFVNRYIMYTDIYGMYIFLCIDIYSLITYPITYSFVYQALYHTVPEKAFTKVVAWNPCDSGFGFPTWRWFPENLKGSWWFLIPFFRPYFL